MRWIDVDLPHQRLYIKQAWTYKAGYGSTKSSYNRTIPISKNLEVLLEELKCNRQQGDEYVLPHFSAWKKGAQAEYLRSFCIQIGVTSVRFHDLRATFISQLALSRVSLAQIMAIAGHSNIKTTNRYIRILGTDLIGTTDKLEYGLPQVQQADVLNINLLRGR